MSAGTTRICLYPYNDKSRSVPADCFSAMIPNFPSWALWIWKPPVSSLNVYPWKQLPIVRRILVIPRWEQALNTE